MTADEARHALRQIMFSDALDVCAAVLSIVVVWQLLRRLERATLPTPPEVLSQEGDFGAAPPGC